MSNKPTSVPAIPRKPARKQPNAPVVIYDEEGPIVVVTRGGRVY
jgi:hypothetical protein